MSTSNYNYTNSPGPGPGSPGPRPPRKDDSWDGLSWVIGVGLIFATGPFGLFLTIAHAMGHDIVGSALSALFGSRRKNDTGRQAAEARAAQAWAKADAAWAKASQTQARAAAPNQAEARPEDHVRHADAGATVKTVFGWILAAFGLFMTMGAVFDGAGIWSLLSTLCIALGGGSLVLSGMMGRRKEAKFRRCITVSGTQGVVDIKKLAKTLGIDLAEADKQLTEMVDRGYYGEKAYIDHERCLLVIDVEDMRDVYRKEDEARAAAEKEKMTEYERYVERIRQADVDIEDEVMSEKIRRMQELTASIFAEVQAHPEKKPMIDRFMTYYLPTTLKLLESYARIEKQGVTGENMAKAKKDIEGIADTLVAGYEKQLDKLYKAEAVDIAGDVSVIESMLRRDGLSDKNEFGQTMGGH